MIDERTGRGGHGKDRRKCRRAPLCAVESLMRYLVVAVTLVLVVLLAVSGHLFAQQAAQQKSAPANAASARALLDKYCVTCHNQRLKTANLTFDTMDLAHVANDGE